MTQLDKLKKLRVELESNKELRDRLAGDTQKALEDFGFDLGDLDVGDFEIPHLPDLPSEEANPVGKALFVPKLIIMDF